MTARWTWHGGGLTAARARFGVGRDPWIDLSTGINPYGWPGVSGLDIDWHRLPDEADLRALERAAAAYFGADPADVCAVPGSEIGLRLIGERLDGPVFHRIPSYRTHGAMVSAAVPVAADRLADADGASLILANPNNPDGSRLDRAAMLDLLDRRGPGWLLVDEAFADTAAAPGMAAQVGDDRRLIVFRSFGKFFGLAGLRLGFVLGPRAAIDPLRDRLGAWPLSAAAIAIGTAAYADAAWIARTRARLKEAASTLDAMLREAGFDPRGACPLFRLIETADAMALFERLARRAILTRPFDERPQWLRLGLPADRHDLARLEAALRDG
ncbi:MULTISPECIES: aminotransferase class I/II-fold pyridoxal phosphate-dependent enzyme [unclassified Sphingomonas]|uniref:aminotransferase class I/II-fold pyridoxal phosphate-dependent enzyme n=1 Tax=unclassified Sphingomonas TaxID=196159 RepID=UPI0006F82F85|nr:MULTISPECIES: aminotransferase class I/II-fold pyridoxal phosphate-dependent enzyme [unclassified Sphingomonas]KQX19402.1 threonine-phosphate decarboxylase [Sphingomonas sp. Root1294]KQY65604.1 threonine-phosphate decarboxylase [Sphingomonas sp. Root50]KRB95094.1 threonine-phosphate decarboxylase [Sphingomonas sp. Root720]